MNVLPIIQHEYFEIVIPANSATSKIFFPDIHKLRYANLRGIELYTELDFVTGLNGIDILPASRTMDSWITLNNTKGKAFVDKRYSSLFYTDNPSNQFSPLFQKDFVGQITNFPKSYIEFVPPLVTGTAQTLAFSVYYSNENEIVSKDIMKEIIGDVENTRSMPIIKCRYVEIEVAAGYHSQINIPDQPDLRDVLVRGIEVINDNITNNAFSGIGLVSVNDLNQSWLTLQLYNGEDSVERIPTPRLFTGDFGADPYSKIQPRGFAKQKLNWPNCFFEFIPTLFVSRVQTIVLNIYYEDNEVVELKDELYEFSNKL